MLDIDELFINLNDKLQNFLKSPKENRVIAYDIQIILLDYILKIENEIRDIKEKIKANKLKCKDKNLKNDIRRELSIETKELKELSIVYKEDMKRLREIGDSLAFSYFSKYYLKSFCWKQSAGFIGGKDGLKNELNKLKSIFDEGGFAILNDITNSLRYGDITVDDNGKPRLLEIKSSSNKNERIIRQQQDIDHRMEMINNDYLESFLGTDKKFKRVYSKNAEINYIEELQVLIDEAIQNGSVIKEIEEGLVYNIQYKTKDFKILKYIEETMNEPKVFFVNQMKNINENYTPFPILIKNNDYLMEFYSGNLLISVFIDLEVVKRKIEEKGYLFDISENHEFIITFDLNGDNISMNTSTYHIWRIGREFLSLKWFIDEIENVVNSIKMNK
ncbi:hypothetical protein [Clostridium perfringens]|uniref:hypothetical protein n=1 Tax=Clostridium perfringens TaxID=1502 RepID=UPI001CCB91AD|nr:hypothetical protein [Clostridium perfringens]MDM0471347.1 hypothetical protein [Clostridium perfringens]MDM0479516.1 hypothetical protein [Clostridium perfringens]MDM0496241.1 hypothetical protein [Clostridium perfringens]UBK87734.1 hypothetical protein KLF48_09065 [Clostridium perfringens]